MEEDTFKEELKADLKEALKEVKEAEEGIVNLGTMDELYAELEKETVGAEAVNASGRQTVPLR